MTDNFINFEDIIKANKQFNKMKDTEFKLLDANIEMLLSMPEEMHEDWMYEGINFNLFIKNEEDFKKKYLDKKNFDQEKRNKVLALYKKYKK